MKGVSIVVLLVILLLLLIRTRYKSRIWKECQRRRREIPKVEFQIIFPHEFRASAEASEADGKIEEKQSDSEQEGHSARIPARLRFPGSSQGTPAAQSEAGARDATEAAAAGLPDTSEPQSKPCSSPTGSTRATVVELVY